MDFIAIFRRKLHVYILVLFSNFLMSNFLCMYRCIHISMYVNICMYIYKEHSVIKNSKGALFPTL